MGVDSRRDANQRNDNYEAASHTADWSRLGERIRAARKKLGLSLADLAEWVHVGEYTMGQIEAGEDDPGRRVIDLLDAKFGAEGVLADAWAQVYISHHVRSGSRVDQLQREASQIRAFSPLMLPDWYQTEAYHQALNRVERPMECTSYVADRPKLRSLMATGSGPPFHCLILDEAVLHRRVGTPEVMREQLAHLHRLAQASYITLHLIPSGTAHHPGLRGAFWTLDFSPRHTLAYTPHPRGPGALVTDATQIKGYIDLYATLQGAALPADASLTLLEETIEQAQPRKAITSGTTPDPGDPLAQHSSRHTRQRPAPAAAD
ncbi:helix-turn-helix domain-containing protein [Salinactinospora qingdaonensis]|uniref:Helix-turn-helix transcriptional regulator n=1 Tax=Salinactinospora qingdaonensis TaxID=702744 RepID=A0ABP7FRR7_9ACTN